MDKVKFSKLFDFQKKSKIKAGDGLKLDLGKYPFYTSSNKLSKSIDNYLFNSNSLIFGTGGLASIHCSNNKFAVSTDCLVAQPKNEKIVDCKFVYYYLSGNIYILEEGFKGAGLKHISRNYIADIQIPLPPLKTQKHIAQILDDAAALRDKTAELLKEYDLLAQSIFLEMFGDSYHNPKEFELVKINYFIKQLKSGKSVNSTNDDYKIGGIGILKTSCVYNGVFDYSEAKVIKESEIKLAKLNPKKGSIIISRMNTEDLVGKSAYVNENYQNLFLPDRLWQSVKSQNDHSVLWLSYAISQGSFMKSISRVATGTSGSMKNVSQNKFLNLQIINPPLELQNQFAKKIALIEQQKELAKQELKESEDLFNCLLQKAFKGELI